MSSEIKDTNSPKTVAQFIAETKEADPELYAQAMREVEEQEQAETSKATLDTRLETVRDYLSPDGYYNGLGHAKTVQDARDEIERLTTIVAASEAICKARFHALEKAHLEQQRLRAENEQLRKPAPTLASLIRRERAGDDRSYD